MSVRSRGKDQMVVGALVAASGVFGILGVLQDEDGTSRLVLLAALTVAAICLFVVGLRRHTAERNSSATPRD
jgi:hypothetical protein